MKCQPYFETTLKTIRRSRLHIEPQSKDRHHHVRTLRMMLGRGGISNRIRTPVAPCATSPSDCYINLWFYGVLSCKIRWYTFLTLFFITFFLKQDIGRYFLQVAFLFRAEIAIETTPNEKDKACVTHSQNTWNESHL